MEMAEGRVVAVLVVLVLVLVVHLIVLLLVLVVHLIALLSMGVLPMQLPPHLDHDLHDRPPPA
jgi:hypothetical protein